MSTVKIVLNQHSSDPCLRDVTVGKHYDAYVETAGEFSKHPDCTANLCIRDGYTFRDDSGDIVACWLTDMDLVQ